MTKPEFEKSGLLLSVEPLDGARDRHHLSASEGDDDSVDEGDADGVDDTDDTDDEDESEGDTDGTDGKV